MRNVYLTASVRTPIGRFGGTLASCTAADLGVAVAKASIGRAGLRPDRIQQSIWGCVRQAQDLAKLQPVFAEDGSVTAGNSSGITDGAAAVIVMSEEALKQSGAEAQAWIVDYEVAGVAPEIMGIGPVPAIRSLLARQGFGLSEVELIELNEAFAAQVIACDRELSFDSHGLNVNGGAIALGHPIGCTGVRITTTLVHEMRRRSAKFGLSTLCVSGGMGIALLLERP